MARKRRKNRKGRASLDAGTQAFIIRANTSTRAHQAHRNRKREANRMACRKGGYDV